MKVFLDFLQSDWNQSKQCWIRNQLWGSILCSFLSSTDKESCHSNMHTFNQFRHIHVHTLLSLSHVAGLSDCIQLNVQVAALSLDEQLWGWVNHWVWTWACQVSVLLYQVCLSFTMKSLSLLSVPQVLTQRHVPALPGSKWPKEVTVGTTG